MALKPRQKAFVLKYIELGEAYPAAREAGYPDSTALNASKWINPDILNSPSAKERKKFKPEVYAAVQEQLKDMQSPMIADAEEVLRYLTSVMRGKSQSSVVVVETQIDGTSKAREMPKKPDEKERLSAAEKLGKRYGLFTEKIEADVDADLSITINYGDD